MTYAMLLSSHRLVKVLEWMALFAVLIGIAWPWLGRGILQLRQGFRDLARSRARTMLAVAAFPMLVRALMLPWFPPPPPQIHDEFSYLLQGDTFAHGRVANPTPPYWQHFESEYVLLKPAYASQYQPAQGLVLASGQLIFGHPWFGVWLSMGLLFAALFWGLSYVFPATWALLGTCLAALQFGVFGLWMNSYFGGAVAAAAGALIVGAMVRMRHAGKAQSSAALCAFALILLFASRPFEGLLWTAVCVASFLIAPPQHTRKASLRLAWAPFAAVFIVGAIGLAWYNWRITGNPAIPPYLEYRRIYGTPQPFWWQKPFRVSGFNYAVLRDNYLNQVRLYEHRYSLSAILLAERDRLRDFWRFFIGPFLTPALLFLPWALRDRRLRPWLWISIPFIVGKATYHAWFPAHNAPETILIFIVVVQCWRHMWTLGRARGAGMAISRNLVTACGLTLLLGAAGRASEPLLPAGLRHLPPIWESLYPARRLRDDVNAALERLPGKHLVFVKYEEGHCFCEEWVFNGADIRTQRIVYARPYTPESDEALANVLGDRDIWLVEPDERPYRLTRVSPSDVAFIATSGKPGNDLFDLSQHQGAAGLP